MRQTTYPKGELKERKWYIIDVKDCVLGRVASRVAMILNGKTNINYVPYANNAPGVIILNSQFIKVTGNKLNKPFYWHTGFPGGLKQRTIEQRLNSNNPEHVFFKAVERMMPKTILGRHKMKNLRVFAHENHIYQSLKPEIINLQDEHKMNKLKENIDLKNEIKVNKVKENIDLINKVKKNIDLENKINEDIDNGR